MTAMLLILASCQINAVSQTIPTAIPTATIPSTPNIDKKNQIIEQIRQIAASYDQRVEDEKKAGTFKIVALKDGSEGFAFTGASYDRIVQQELLTQTKIQELNEEYFTLYEEDTMPTASATPSTRLEQQARLDQLENDEQAWAANELRQGTTVMLYSNPARKYVPFLIGDSYAVEQEKLNEINALRLQASMPPADLINLDIRRIQSLEPGAVTLTDIGVFPYYRADLKLTTYQTGTRTYNVYSPTHQIIEILPKQIPPGATNLSPADLEMKAVEMIAVFSPEVKLDPLTADEPGMKMGDYFFRWEDRTKPFLDDGRSYPFVQVGLNGNGELLNYYNTLPLAR